MNLPSKRRAADQSNALLAWDDLMDRRDQAAAALAAIDQEIAAVRDRVGAWSMPPAPPPARASNPLRDRLSRPSPVAALREPGGKSQEARTAVMRALAAGPMSRRELVAATRLSETRVIYAANKLMKQRVLVRVGSAPTNYKFSLRSAATAIAPAPAKKNGDGHEVVWSGSDSVDKLRPS